METAKLRKTNLGALQPGIQLTRLAKFPLDHKLIITKKRHQRNGGGSRSRTGVLQLMRLAGEPLLNPATTIIPKTRQRGAADFGAPEGDKMAEQRWKQQPAGNIGRKEETRRPTL